MPNNEKLSLYKKALTLLIANSFIYVAPCAYGAFLSAYYASQGISVSQIGTLLAVGPVTAVLIQPLWARISDKTHRRKGVLMIVVTGCAVVLWGYYLHSSFLAYLGVTFAMSFFSTSVGPLCDTIVVQESRRLHLNFAHIRLGGTIGYSIMVLIAGAVYARTPYAVFGISSVLYALMLLVISRLPPDQPAPGKKKKKQSPRPEEIPEEEGPAPRGFLGLFVSSEIVFMLLFALIAQIGMSFYASFFGVYMLDLGYGAYIGLGSCIGALSEVPVLLTIDRIRRRFGTATILMCAGLLAALRVLLITGGSLFFVLLAQLIQGLSGISIYFCCVMYISEHVLPGKQSQGQSFLAILQAGLGSIIGNIVGGHLVDVTGLRSAYYIVALIVVVVTLCNRAAYFFYTKRGTSAPPPAPAALEHSPAGGSR